jgi:hypothetical protein
MPPKQSVAINAPIVHTALEIADHALDPVNTLA